MSDILTEMQGVVHDARPAVASAWTEAAPTAAREEAKRNAEVIQMEPGATIEAGPEGATIGPSPAAQAEMALLKHLALEGELALRRDQLAQEHQAVSERLAQARQQRAGLVRAVREAGGELPRWDL